MLPFDPRIVNMFWSRVDKSGSCWEWKGFLCDGYGSFKPGSSLKNIKAVKAHRFSYLVTFGDIPDGMHVLHKCDNRSCVNPEHLFLGTDKDNARDRESKGRSNPNQGKHTRNVFNVGKLNRDQIIAIRDMADSRIMSQQAIADQFGVTQVCVSQIFLRKTWCKTLENSNRI